MPREKRSIVSQLEGSLLISKNLFPYFMLVAFEAGGPFRAVILLLLSPVIRFLEFARFEDASLGVLIFVSTVGLRIADMDAVAKATLPRFFLEDLRESAYRVFSRCGGKKHVMTCIPRIMVEPFLRDYLDVDHIIGTEMRVSLGGYCTGLVTSKSGGGGGGTLETMRACIGGGEEIDIGLGHGLRDHSFMSLCQELHPISPEEKPPSALSRTEYPRPLIFHDGRLVTSPTVIEATAVTVWLPLGILTAIARILVGVLLPYKLTPMFCAVTGLRIRVRLPTSATGPGTGNSKLYVCSHRTLLDPVFISTALQRRVSAVTYSLSRLSELISPIPTTRLTRDRPVDSKTMRSLLTRGDLVVCPEGTTCREPYLLRFSPLFAEISDDIVPVAVTADGSMFYGTTVRGYKCLDSFFFLMNPTPLYRMTFLDPHPRQHAATVTANQIQRCIGEALGFECTNLTRKDKYRMLAGNDGVDLRCTK